MIPSLIFSPATTNNKSNTISLVTKAERRMHVMAQKSGMTPEGESFLIAALDPMHDKPIKDVDGWPDLETSPSLVRCVKQTMQISRPTAYSTTATWALHIVNWPTTHDRGSTRCTMNGTNLLIGNPIVPGPRIGGVKTYCSTSNTFNFLQPAIPGGTITEGPSLSLSPDFDKGYGRLIACGIEIVDTTAVLNRQGYITCYKQAHGSAPPITHPVSQAANSGHVTETFVRCPPLTLDDAMLIPGTTQWETQKGAYMVSTFTGSDNPPQPPNFTGIIIHEDLTTGATQPLALPALITEPIYNGTAIYNGYTNKIERTNQSGMILSGLNPLATFSLKWVVWYETFPGTSDPNDLTLASPPCPYDPVALEYLKRISAELPVAVPFDENPLGEWFWDIVDTLSTLAPAIGGLFGPPGAVLGTAISTANQMRKRNQNPTKQRKR